MIIGNFKHSEVMNKLYIPMYNVYAGAKPLILFYVSWSVAILELAYRRHSINITEWR